MPFWNVILHLDFITGIMKILGNTINGIDKIRYQIK